MVLRQLETDSAKQKFSTICLDTIGIAYDLAEKFICQQNGVQKIGEIPYGGGYAALSKEFEESLRKITMMGYGLIMTCHLKESADEDGRLSAAKPDLNNRCLKIVNGLVDIIAVITQTWNDKNESERWVITRSTPNITAGSRFRYLAPKIPFGYNEFVKALGEAIAQEEQHGATVVDHLDKTTTTEKLDFNAVRAEAQELWIKLTTDNEDKAIEILKKIEMTMGHKMKLSEFTEDQVDLLYLCLQDMKVM